MTITRWALILLATFIFTACKRKGAVATHVSSIFDGSPVEGVPVRVYYNCDAVIRPNAFGKLPVVNTDANGDCIINATYKRKAGCDYYVDLDVNENYIEANPFAVKDTTSTISKTWLYFSSQYKGLADKANVKKTKRKQDFDFKVAPCARLKIVARNLPPANVSDVIYVNVMDENLESGTMTVYLKADVTVPEEGKYLLVPTNGKVVIKCVLNTNNHETQFYDTIVLPPYTKTTYYINY